MDVHWLMSILTSVALVAYMQMYTCTHICTHTTHNYALYQLEGTALHFAVYQEHEDIVEQLLDANADPNLPKKVIHMHHDV